MNGIDHLGIQVKLSNLQKSTHHANNDKRCVMISFLFFVSVKLEIIISK